MIQPAPMINLDPQSHLQLLVHFWNQTYQTQINLNDLHQYLTLQQTTKYNYQNNICDNNDDNKILFANMRNDKELSPIAEEKELGDLDPSAPAFTPTLSPSSSPSLSPSLSPSSPPSSPPSSVHFGDDEYENIGQFIPKYPARANLNIYIAPKCTNDLLNKIIEKFPSTQTLYYYIDISTALQINDGEMNVFFNKITKEKVIFVNYDLHYNKNGDILYGIITKNDQHNIRQNKWLWKLDEFLNCNDIYLKYGIMVNQLPKSSRNKISFKNLLNIECDKILNINIDIIYYTDWTNIQQIKCLRRESKKNKNKRLQFAVKLNKFTWIEQCKLSWNKYNAIPIVVNENKNNINKHWIEWIKLIEISNNNIFGISCKYILNKNKWQITSICLDKGDIQNKHRLIGLNHQIQEKYLKYFDNFNTSCTEIQWIKS